MLSSYFIFDMDETLAELYSVYYFIATLRLKERNIPSSLIYDLNKGYNIFVGKVLSKEISNEPLGILRPGILDIMKKLSELQKVGKIKNVVIYSNNGHLESLEFIKDLIHKYVQNSDLIKECIHWNHPMRNAETLGQPGAANKTWNVLRNILIKGNCKASLKIDTKDIYFFDDLDHTDLKSNLGENYYQVPGYSFKASYDRLADIFKDSLKELNLNDKSILRNIVIELFGDRNTDLNISDGNDLDIIINLFKSKTRGTVGSNILPPIPDNGIDMMINAIDKVRSIKGGKGSKARISRKKSKVKRYRIKSKTKKN